MSKKRKLHYPRKWSWPNGAKICVSLNMALESFVRASQVTLESVSTNGLTGERHPKIVRTLALQGCAPRSGAQLGYGFASSCSSTAGSSGFT